jgi:chitodextrinase
MDCSIMSNRVKNLLVLALAAFSASCTVSRTPAPPLMGPSEMSLSLALSANPDVLSLDGASQAQITIEARDSNGQPAPNVPLRIDIVADGQLVDYGMVSARTLVTGSNGRATFTYTAPPLVGSDIPRLELMVTPTGSGDASSHIARVLSIRLVPPGIIIPGGLAAVFAITPNPATAFNDVLFDASQSRSGVGTAIVSYNWSFGDGTSASGVNAAHKYSAGTYTVTLTVTDSNGLTSSSSQILLVQPGISPTAAFVFSPAQPLVGQTVFFNGGQSTAGPGRRIVSYRYNFGDGTTGSGSTRSHVYTIDGAYTVVLTVTDDVGQVGTTASQVVVCPPGGCVEEDE